MVKSNRSSCGKTATAAPPSPKDSDGDKVQHGQESPAKASELCPKWSFRNATTRLKIKRLATPQPKPSGRVAKRPAPSPSPVIGRIRKRIAFELPEDGKHTRASPGPFEACGTSLKEDPGYLPLQDHERRFVVGAMGEDEMPQSLPKLDGFEHGIDGDSVMKETSTAVTQPGPVSGGSTPSGQEERGHNEAMVEEEGASMVSVAGQDLSVNKPPEKHHEAAGNGDVSHLNGRSMERGTTSHMEPKTSLVHCGVGGSLVACACDLLIGKGSNHLLKVQESVASFLANVDQNSNVMDSPSAYQPCVLENGVLASNELGPKKGAGVHPPEPLPVVQNPADSSSEPHNVPSSGVATPKDEEGPSGKDENILKKDDARICEPVTFEVGKAKEMGRAGSHEGIPSLSFTDEETTLLADKLGHAIIGKFSLTIPSAHQIQKALANIHFVDGFKWKILNARHILIQFRDIRDYGRLLNGPNGAPLWYIEQHQMRVFKWTPEFNTFEESPIAVVWCKIIGIPIHLYDQSALYAIGKLLGKPIQVDHATINQSRLSFARICVEIDISAPPPEEIILNILGKDNRYKVVWERIPLFCVECNHVGHLKEACLTLRKKKEGQPTKDPNRPFQHSRSGSAPKATRQEWRPKNSVNDTHSSKADREGAAKDEVELETSKAKRDADMKKSSKAPTAPQVQVDEEGFQLVTKRRKGKSILPLHQDQEGHHKASYLEKLLKGGNVAMVSFGEANVEMIDPGGGSST